MIKIKINNLEYEVEENITILEAAKRNGIMIPTLCFLKDINENGNCRICVVEVTGYKNLVASCLTKVKENMEIFTESERVVNSRTMTLALMLSNHKKDCDNCLRNNNCEFKILLEKYNVDNHQFIDIKNNYNIDDSTNYLVKDNDKCILCGRCVATCKKVQGLSVIGRNERGIKCHVGNPFEIGLKDSPCVACGQCVMACPTGALVEKDDTKIVEEALKNKNLHVVVGCAPSVRASLGELFDYKDGKIVTGKMISALKSLGFSKVFDIDFTADLTIIEEGQEFINKLNAKDQTFPMFTSCCPAWINYVEMYDSDLIKNLSSCKSPQQMFGSVVKNYYQQKIGIKKDNIFVVSIMPCLAKKYEASKNEDIDVVLSVRELARLIKKNKIDFKNLKEENFDTPFSTGGSLIFGTSGGVMESALRAVKEIIENKSSEKIDFKEVRGLNGIKEATYKINNQDIKVAVVSGLKNVKELLKQIKSKKKFYHFVEVMACPGGCINGGGQPINKNYEARVRRSESLYLEENNLPFKMSTVNQEIKDLYTNYLENPGSKKAHDLLHTEYQKKNKYNQML